MLHDSIYVKFWKRQYRRHRKQTCACLRLRIREGDSLQRGMRNFWGDEHFYIFIVVVVIQLCTIAQTQQITRLK